VFSQSQIEYKRIYSGVSTLTLYEDLTFTEIYNNFTCGNYANFLGDTIFKGSWVINKDTIHLKYYDLKNTIYFSTEFLNDTSNNRLVSIDKNDFSYHKTKEYFNGTKSCVDVDPSELIQQFEHISINSSYKELNIFITKIRFWSELNGDASIHLGKMLIENISIEYDTYFETAFLIGKLECLINKENADFSKKIQSGLLFALKKYNENQNLIPEMKIFKKISRLNRNGKLEHWVYKKLKKSMD
jgi:hypothetical protein